MATVALLLTAARHVAPHIGAEFEAAIAVVDKQGVLEERPDPQFPRFKARVLPARVAVPGPGAMGRTVLVAAAGSVKVVKASNPMCAFREGD